MARKKDRLTNELSKYVGLGQWAKAVQTLESLIALEPGNSHYRLRMGDYSLKAGNKPAAIKYYYQAADMYVKAGFTVKAIATYKMILKIAPNETEAMSLMKNVNTASGLLSNAFELEQAFSPAKPDPEVKESYIPEEPEALPIAVEMPLELERELVPPPFRSPEAEREPEPEPEPEREPEQERHTRPVVRAGAPETARVIPAPTVEGWTRTSTEKKNINVLFASFTQDEFGAIVDRLEPLEFMDGERIIAEGDEGNGMYLITRGGGKVVKEYKGEEVELCELGEGEFFGELSLLEGGRRSASVFAKGETEALRLKSADLLEVMKQYPRLEGVLEEFSRAMKQKMRPLPE